MTANEKTLRVLAAVAAVAAIGEVENSLSVHVRPETLRAVAAETGGAVEALGKPNAIGTDRFQTLRLEFIQRGIVVTLLASELVLSSSQAEVAP